MSTFLAGASIFELRVLIIFFAMKAETKPAS
jgi:hypothetical protein